MPPDYTMLHISDIHLGALNHSSDALNSMIHAVKSERDCYVMEGGDTIEAILPHDVKRFSLETLSIPQPLEQVKAAIKTLKPIADRIVSKGYGNHEHKLISFGNIGKLIAEGLNVSYGGVCYKFVALRKGKPVHKFFIHHGYGSLPKGAKDPIQRKANIQAAIRRKLENTGHADCIYMGFGHTHYLDVVQPTATDNLYLTDNGKGIKQHYRVMTKQDSDFIPPDSRWYGNSGSFRRTLTTPGLEVTDYAEIGMFAPSELGWIKIRVEDCKVVSVEKVIA